MVYADKYNYKYSAYGIIEETGNLEFEEVEMGIISLIEIIK